MTTAATHHEHGNTPAGTLFVAFELSEKTWKLSFTTGHGQKPRERTVTGRCRKGVDSVLDCYPKLVAIDEQPDHQVVHGRRFGKANRATHETFDPCPQIDVFAFDFLHVFLA